MHKHTRQILERSNISTVFTQNIGNTPDDDPFPSDNPWESSFQGIDTPTDDSTMSTQPHHTS